MHKQIINDQMDGLVAKNMHRFFGGQEFGSQHPHQLAPSS